MAVELLNDFNLPAGTVIVDFAAEWCGPCKAMYPILEELSEKYADKLSVVKLDISDHMDIATQHRVMNIPCLVVFKDGLEIDRMIGFKGRQTVESLFAKHA